MQSIVTLTINPTIDTSSKVDNVVANTKLRCQTPRHDPGGGGINVSRVIKRLGGSSKAIYPAGGTNGEMLKELLDREGIEHLPISIANMTRENVMILETNSGKQYRFGMPGPELSESEWKECLHKIETLEVTPDYIVGSGSIPPGVPDDFYAQLAELATKIDAKLIVDTSGKALTLAAEAGVYLLKPNLNELQHLADAELNSEEEREKLAKKLIDEKQAETIVVSLGTAGALLVTSETSERIRAPIVTIKSRVGAGDSMVAGIVLRLAQGHPIDVAVRYGIAAGSAAVMTPGTELCRAEDTNRLYRYISETLV